MGESESQDKSSPEDYSGVWLKAKKALATYEAAVLHGQWATCVDAASELRTLSTDLLLFARYRDMARSDRG